jgi:chaperonin GroES
MSAKNLKIFYKIRSVNMNFQPLGARVLVKRVEEENKTASGIIIPDNAKEKPSRASVVAAGGDVEGISVGDVVVFGKYNGTDLSLDGEDYLVLEQDDILGIIK